MGITAAQLIEGCKKRLGWGYVLGGQGELYSQAVAEKFYRYYKDKPRSYYFETCARWFGHRVVDCSGLVIEAIRDYQPTYNDRTANTLFNECRESGEISSLPEIPGVCVWKSGHIGVYIGGGKVIESRGYAYGVVITDVKTRPWTHWGKLAAVDYSVKAKAETATEKTTVKTTGGTCEVKTIVVKSGVKGEAVKTVQRLLNAVISAGLSVDGSCGPKTTAAIKKYQKAKGLSVDGSCGAATWTRLING